VLDDDLGMRVLAAGIARVLAPVDQKHLEPLAVDIQVLAVLGPAPAAAQDEAIFHLPAVTDDDDLVLPRVQDRHGVGPPLSPTYTGYRQMPVFRCVRHDHFLSD
jgi:hypothetical protein